MWQSEIRTVCRSAPKIVQDELRNIRATMEIIHDFFKPNSITGKAIELQPRDYEDVTEIRANNGHGAQLGRDLECIQNCIWLPRKVICRSDR